MKYVRTKDGIYDETKVCLIAEPIAGEIFVEEMIDSYTSHLEKVITQANTIEELCDLFMLEPTMKDLTPIDFKQLWRAKKAKNIIKLETTLYGAIWVKGKGLIYVAKLNDKGELELI